MTYSKKYWREYWRKNRFKILLQRKYRYLYDREYKKRIKQRTKILQLLNVFFSKYKMKGGKLW